MAHHGVKETHNDNWRKFQRKLGRMDALAGQPAACADVWYRKGYKQGEKERKR